MTKTILTPGQRRLLLVVLVLAAFLLGNAAYLWLRQPEVVLPVFYQWMLVSHVVVGILILAPMSVFIVWHMKRALAMQNRRAIWTGLILTVAMFGLAVTGLFIFEKANSAGNRWAFLSHQVLALVVPLGYVTHRIFSRHKPTLRGRLVGVVAPLAVLGVALVIHHGTLPEAPIDVQDEVPRPEDGVDPWRDHFPGHGAGGADPASVFAPASTTTTSGDFLEARLVMDDDLLDPELHARELEKYGFVVNAQLGAATCARCHQDIVEQWTRSAHRYSSFNNPFYRVSIEDLRAEEDGKRRSQWCAGCHDPAVMMAGNWMDDIDPTVPESQAGLTCLACHAIDKIHGVGGNGNYRIRDDQPDPYLFAAAKGGPLALVNDLLVKSKPDVHKREMLTPVFRTAEFCATCHKVSLDEPVNQYRWMRGQDEYDNWHDSGVSRNAARTFYLPATARSCRDCHMPLVDAPLGDVSAKNGKVRSHLFPGPNTALPHIQGDVETVRAKEEFLKGALRVEVFAVKHGDAVHTSPVDREITVAAGGPIELQVVVRNAGTGHTFPGGTTDSNQAWVHLQVTAADEPETVLFESGAVDPTSLRVDPGAHGYRTVMIDEQGHEADRRNAADFRTPAFARVIGPGTADIVRYALDVPDDLAGRRLRVRATVRWRKFTRQYTEYTWSRVMKGRPVPELPITDVASSMVELAVASGAAPEPAPLAPFGELDYPGWVRWNDWGIGLLLQGDTRGASDAFGRIRDAEPDRVDGWRNLARVALRDGNVRAALDLLQEADARDPGNAQTAYFFGVALEKAGDLEAAIDAFERAREAFPGDRTIHAALGRIRYKLGDLEEALQDLLRVLAIDPEHRVAHYYRFQTYTLLAADDPSYEIAAREAEKAYRKYQPDESAQRWTEEFRRANPLVNREDQPVHVHRLERLR